MLVAITLATESSAANQAGIEQTQILEQTQTLEVGGESLLLKDLGPVIINIDGTTRRISNWKLLSKMEQERTWKRIAKRNKERLAVLEKKQADEQITQESDQEEELPIQPILSLPSGNESEDDLAAALTDLDAINSAEDSYEPRIPSMF